MSPHAALQIVASRCQASRSLRSQQQAADCCPSGPTAFQTYPHLRPAMAQQIVSATAMRSVPHFCSACTEVQTPCLGSQLAWTMLATNSLGVKKQAWLPLQPMHMVQGWGCRCFILSYHFTLRQCIMCAFCICVKRALRQHIRCPANSVECNFNVTSTTDVCTHAQQRA